MTTRIVHDGSINAVCDTESTRYALGGVHVMPTGEENEVYLSATDGRCLAIVKADGHVDDYDVKNPPIVPASIFPKSAKERRALQFDPDAACSKDVRLNGSGKWETPYDRTADVVEGRFPRCHEVIPYASGTTMVVTLDVPILKKLHDALTEDGTRGIDLLFTVPEQVQGGPHRYSDAVCVQGNRGIGVIMPLYMHDKTAPGQGAHEQFERYRQEYAACYDRHLHGFAAKDVVAPCNHESAPIPEEPEPESLPDDTPNETLSDADFAALDALLAAS